MNNDEIVPIDYPLIETKEPRWYKCFKYKSKKPSNIVSAYIRHYTKEGEIVLDPFVGSGVTAIESILAKRKIVAIDLNPVSTLITKSIIKPIDLDAYETEFRKISKKLEDKIGSMYQTRCRICKSPVEIIATSRFREAAGIDKELRDVRYYCSRCDEKRTDSPTKKDIRKLQDAIQQLGSTKLWYPKGRLEYDNGREFEKAEKIIEISRLFTNRNLLSLALIRSEIEGIHNSDVKNLMYLTFVTMIHLASKLCPVRVSRPYSSHWGRDTGYWVPKVYMEQNVWTLFERAFDGKQGILKAKKAIQALEPDVIEARTFSDLESDANFYVKTASVLDLDEIVPNSSIDYVFTDPPYGGSVQYGEIATLHASWLNERVEYDDELTINKQQNKDFDHYYHMLHSAFRNIFDVLKTRKWMSVTFHHTKMRVFNAIMKAPRYAGFDLKVSPIYQRPLRAGVKALAQPFGSATGDYYLNFQKPKHVTIPDTLKLSSESQKRIVIDAVKEIIAKRGEPTSFTDILRGIHSKLAKHGYYPLDETEAKDVLSEFSDIEFTRTPALDVEGETVGSLWWLKNPDDVKYLSRIPLEERIEQAVLRILKREIKVDFDDVLQEIYREYTNAMCPDRSSVELTLKQYASPTKDGKWRLSPTYQEYETEHSKMIAYLAQIGEKAGFDVWIGKREQGEKWKTGILSDLMTLRNLRISYPDAEVANIDVLWLDKGRIRYAFEVENTTTITEAVERSTNIKDANPHRFIIIPERRKTLIIRKLRNSWTGVKLRKDGWKFIFYRKLKEFYEQTKRKRKIDLAEFEDLAGLGKIIEQSLLQDHLKETNDE